MKPVIKLNTKDFSAKVLEYCQDKSFEAYYDTSPPLRKEVSAGTSRVFETKSTIYIETPDK